MIQKYSIIYPKKSVTTHYSYNIPWRWRVTFYFAVAISTQYYFNFIQRLKVREEKIGGVLSGLEN